MQLTVIKLQIRTEWNFYFIVFFVSDLDSEDKRVSSIELHLFRKFLVSVHVRDVTFTHQPENKQSTRMNLNGLENFVQQKFQFFVFSKKNLPGVSRCYLSRSLSVSGSRLQTRASWIRARVFFMLIRPRFRLIRGLR